MGSMENARRILNKSIQKVLEEEKPVVLDIFNKDYRNEKGFDYSWKAMGTPE